MLLFKAADHCILLKYFLQPVLESEICITIKFSRKNEGVALQVQELIERNPVMCTQLLQLFKTHRLIGPDATVSTIITDV